MSYTENALPHVEGNGVTLVPSVIPITPGGTPAGSDAPPVVPSPVIKPDTQLVTTRNKTTLSIART